MKSSTDQPQPKTAILIPAYNEAGRITSVIRSIRDAGVTFPIVVVDDGSADATASEARRAGATVLSHPHNLGYGSALHTGYCFARRHGYERIVQMDADGQHDPVSVTDLVAALDDGVDVALGSRFLAGTAPPTSWIRRWGTWFFARIVSRWTSAAVTDPTSGFQGLSQRALRELAHDGFPEDYPDADVLITVYRAGLELREIPVVMHPRLSGMSMHRGGRAAYYGYKMLLTLALLPIRRKTPFRHPDSVAETHAA